jgi:hypothetical protein
MRGQVSHEASRQHSRGARVQLPPDQANDIATLRSKCWPSCRRGRVPFHMTADDEEECGNLVAGQILMGVAQPATQDTRTIRTRCRNRVKFEPTVSSGRNACKCYGIMQRRVFGCSQDLAYSASSSKSSSLSRYFMILRLIFEESTQVTKSSMFLTRVSNLLTPRLFVVLTE